MLETPVIIVGAGTLGIATAACLTKKSVPYLILERDDCFASLWQKRTYDRIHLHLRKQFCELPYFPFPDPYPHYVPKKQFIEYLQNYLNHFNINPLYDRAVELAEYDDGSEKWRVSAKNNRSGEVEEYVGRLLVVASGETAEPHVPEIEGLGSFEGEVLHSTGYKNGKEFKDEHVLVVGSGNSGMEIALDLANFGAKPSIIVRSPHVSEVNSEENLVQVEGVVVPTNTAVESGDAMIMEAGELKEAGGNQLQMVTSGSNSKDSMRSGGKVTTENDQGVALSLLLGWVLVGPVSVLGWCFLLAFSPGLANPS
ncbi:hypothetical protein RIF29_38349 [Crotalaria pallida]|uniref:indole-3-pyruvate monooxygenase n=1 Tax=Crotalaria pallida TaxID=3830 RepID=A0AAN9E5D4_CROPI